MMEEFRISAIMHSFVRLNTEIRFLVDFFHRIYFPPQVLVDHRRQNVLWEPIKMVLLGYVCVHTMCAA